MIKLTLAEKYKELADDIIGVENPNWSYFSDNYSDVICDLTKKWFGDEAYCSQVKVIERIHSADEIEWIEYKYNWRLKSEKVFNRYVWSDCDGLLNFCSADYADSDDIMTESEFKKLLEGTGLPFDAFERV